MTKIKYVELDVLKPLEPTLVDLAKTVSSIHESYVVSIDVEERDRETESVQMMIEGNEVDLAEVQKRIEASGATVHSIDHIKVGSKNPSR